MKKHKLFAAVCILSVSILSPLSNQIQAKSLTVNLYVTQNRNTISGHVFNSQRTPVGQIYVELQNEVYSTIARTKTDGSGRYVFTNLSVGRFIVRALPYGTNLEEQSQEVEIVSFVGRGRSTSDNVQKDFYLNFRKDSKDLNAVTGAVYAQEIPEEARKTYEKAITELDNKKVETGIEELQKAIKLFPTYYSALERLGREYINLQKYEEARDAFKRAVAVNDRSFYGWYGLSYASYGLKQFGSAVEAAQKAVTLNSSSVDALLFLGVAQRKVKSYNEAEVALKRAEKLANGKAPDIHWNLALLYAHNLKRYNDAADELEKYLKTQPNAPSADNVKKLIKRYREMTTN